ncbi:putative protein N(5)-glutamine methyltransferase [Pengzhenrongella sp.]|uniref:putative protein N(5)-glutamine methyltransferase n=1 Tax=Pengzhenrongella sp. TaxID=2888820 RepID=UPI002F9549E1
MTTELSYPAVVTRLRAAGCVFAEDEARLLLAAAQTPTELAALVERRVAGFPVEQVIGWAEFCGLRIVVEPGVFVPRRRTELLVREALELLRAAAAGSTAAAAVEAGAAGASGAAGATGPIAARPVVLDLCCGTGAVGAAIAAAVGAIELYAADVDPAEVRCARRNLADAGGRVFEGDLYEPLPATLRGRVDVLVVNAPYVPSEAIRLMPPEARLHEARVALDGGADGLDVQRRVIEGAPAWLAPGGWLLIETSEAQAPHTAEAIARNGLVPRVVRSEDLDGTVVVGRWAAPNVR